jgi:general secretion pathway protein J
VNDRSGEPVVQDLLEGVKSFQVRFYRSSQQSQSNQGIEAGWRTSWETPDDFPAAIELTINSEDYGEIRRRFLTGVEPAQTVKKEGDNNA